ncbi:MAG TPA: MBL fold metallo-hydrolase [Arenimonas sp.]|uniref:MBL fold metallo-hydrolase n=1 Tax=Arenimonas sp. TaxID=1872635 RepID=UPI002BEDBAFA|nr:MBL fold metallo-hydrolase [Arenimonas sp.]HMB56796.1 MBL fold metallo-hydrolase [Arenimonas sp.]
MRVLFHGAAGEVTGSCHEVVVGAQRILLDCGMIQGSDADEARNWNVFAFDAAAIDAVVLSHAHIDHCGRLPLLVQRGFRGPIHAQAATADLLRVMLEDAASLAEMDAERDNRHRREGRDDHVPLFTRKDVAQVLKQVRKLPYDEATSILPGISVILRDAGHILGSASVEIRGEENGVTRRLVFSGDLGPKGTPILRDPEPVPAADLVLLESTYGGRLHRDRAETIAELGDILAQARRDGGNVLIPAFAVGRSQELLYQFALHYDEWQLGHWQIFLDSPMAAKVVEVYDRHEELFDEQARRVWQGRPHPFRLPNLHFTSDVAQSQAINRIHGGAIIIAGSGMCNGGRIRHHLRHGLGNKRNHIIFVGYQANGTLGRRLVDGAERVRIFGEDVAVRARRHTVGGLSAHTDQAGLLAWYGEIGGRPPVVLVHGEDDARGKLAVALRAQFAADVSLATPEMQREV